MPSCSRQCNTGRPSAPITPTATRVYAWAPGEAGELTVHLEPGTYSIYCPVADHEDEGMRRWLKVVH